MNEMIAAVLVGLLLSLSAGVRITFPLLALSLLAFYHEVTLPTRFQWLGTESTVIILCAAAVAETLIHFIPAVGTWMKAAATPLAFVSGTLLMAVPLANTNPLYQWTLAAGLGGGAATLTHLGLLGARTLTGPANVASAGTFGLVWNLGEMALSLLLTLLGGICVVAGWIFGALLLLVLVGALIVMLLQAVRRKSDPARLEPSREI
jgi:hypothetical protein